MNGEARCPIWGTDMTSCQSEAPTRTRLSVDSPRAGGKYFITDQARRALRTKDDTRRARLTSWLVEQRWLGMDSPEVDAATVDQVEHRPRLSVHERADRLLRRISSQLPSVAGIFVHYDEEDLPWQLAWSESIERDEVDYLLDYLRSSGWVDRHGGTSSHRISVEGHARLAQVEQVDSESSKAFVAMWFDESTNEPWQKAIRTGIEDAGYEPVRIDRKEHVNKIDDEIIAELRRARFVVADFTHGADGVRGGVYYEAGFAHGRGIPVVFCCRSDVIEKIHFDTRQYNHITWDPQNLDDFRRRLRTRIEAVIGEGPSRRR